VLAGSSIGAINASIICSAQNAGKDVPSLLEDFWLSLAENISPPYRFLVSLPFISPDKMMAIWSSMYSSFLVIQKPFCPNGLCLILLIISYPINGLIYMT
jgi:hypothetical protein